MNHLQRMKFQRIKQHRQSRQCHCHPQRQPVRIPIYHNLFYRIIDPNRTPVFSTFTALNHGSSGKGQVRVRKSPFYTASPLGSNSKVYKNSFFRRLRSSFSDKDSDDERTDDYGSKSTGWKKKNASRDFFKTGQHTQYGGNHLFLPFVLMG